MIQITWTPAESAEATRRWEAGESATQIARALGRKLTRNAVIGRLHRIGAIRPEAVKARLASGSLQRKLNARQYTPPKPRQPAPIRVTATRTYPLSKAAQPPPKAPQTPIQCEPVGLLERTGCKYPHNDGEEPRGWLFCNAERAGPTYCAIHTAICSGGLPEKRKHRRAA